MSAPSVSPPAALLIDTNVVLDVILGRVPWASEGALLVDAVARQQARGFVAAHSITTVYYFVEKERGRAIAVTAVSDLLQVLTVVPIDAADFQRALALNLKDFEDAVQVAACLKAGAQYLVTRNGKDYRGAPLTPHTPGEMLGILGR